MTLLIIGLLLLTIDYWLWVRLLVLLKTKYPEAYSKLGSPSFFIRRLMFNIDIHKIRLDVGSDFGKIKLMRNAIYSIETAMLVLGCIVVYFSIFVW